MGDGKLVISLDLELMWGVRDIRTVENYGRNILGVHEVIPQLLKVFETYKIKATFACVGFLFMETKAELINNLPNNLPAYDDKQLSPYLGYFDSLGKDATEDLYHYAPRLIEQIRTYPAHEIGSHTFSHFYCLEKGQTITSFKEDIQAAKRAAGKYNINLTSLVLPRNQFNEDYLQVCVEEGILCIRGNEASWLYKPRTEKKESLFRRAFRLIDAYVNISGHNCYNNDFLRKQIPINIPSSRFLRPFSKKLKSLDGLHLQRIKSGMKYAAKNDLTYHLWWHPHNFGINQQENFLFLEKILEYYKELNRTYNFQSYTMTALAETFLKTNNKNEYRTNKELSNKAT
ncbi:MAG: polysaccharide deacetylase family protein [Ginsengibacter sp.]